MGVPRTARNRKSFIYVTLSALIRSLSPTKEAVWPSLLVAPQLLVGCAMNDDCALRCRN